MGKLSHQYNCKAFIIKTGRSVPCAGLGAPPRSEQRCVQMVSRSPGAMVWPGESIRPLVHQSLHIPVI